MSIRPEEFKFSQDTPSFLDHDFFESPYNFYSYLREKQPIFWSKELNAWLITRYQDVKNGLTDKRLVASRGDTYFGLLPVEDQPALKPLNDFFKQWLLFSDPPYHDKVKSLVVAGFTPKYVESLRSNISKNSENLIKKLSQNSSFDLVQDYASPLAISTISNVLGISSQDYLKIVNWTNEIIGFMGTGRPEVVRGYRALNAYVELKAYLYEVFDEKSRSNTDDLISTMVKNQKALNVSDEELLATCANILIDGHEPTTLALSNGIYTLLQNNDQFRKLKGSLELTSGAVEEMLRYEPPFSYAGRRSVETIELYNQSIQPEQRVILLFGGANRDKSIFPNPDSFDITRSPNKHTTFSHGTHYCLGSALSRVTMNEALISFAKDTEKPQIASHPNWRQSIGYRAFDNLTISLGSK